eukprot:5074229-Prorocentrum_lima.AAC.1
MSRAPPTHPHIDAPTVLPPQVSNDDEITEEQVEVQEARADAVTRKPKRSYVRHVKEEVVDFPKNTTKEKFA